MEYSESLIYKYIKNKLGVDERNNFENELLNNFELFQKYLECKKTYYDLNSNEKMPEQLKEKVMSKIKNAFKTLNTLEKVVSIVIKFSNKAMEIFEADNWQVKPQHIAANFRSGNKNPDAFILEKNINGYNVKLKITKMSDNKSFTLNVELYDENANKINNVNAFLIENQKEKEFIELGIKNVFKTLLKEKDYVISFRKNYEDELFKVNLTLKSE